VSRGQGFPKLISQYSRFILGVTGEGYQVSGGGYLVAGSGGFNISLFGFSNVFRKCFP